MELPFLVCASSLKRHSNGNRNIVLHAIHSDPIVHDTYFRGLNSGAFEVRLWHVDNRLADLLLAPYPTAATLLRLLLPAILVDVNRVVYLDCDLVVLKDITELYETNLLGLPLAACLDYPMGFAWPNGDARTVDDYISNVVGLTDWKTYFNCGVLVIDLEHFRKIGLAQAAEEFLERTRYRLFEDQDALNHVIDGAYVRLDPRWNVHAAWTEVDFRNAYGQLAAVATLWKSDPWILHFTGSGKPWRSLQPSIKLDHYFWREAMACEALPLLLRSYLEDCERFGLTKLRPAAVLLHDGKPRLDKRDILAHAEKFRHVPVISQASESLAADLERSLEIAEAGTMVMSADDFSRRGGRRVGNIVTFDLKAAAGDIIFGPGNFISFPVGNYEACFEFCVTGEVRGRAPRLRIGVFGSDRRLARRTLYPFGKLSKAKRSLKFTVDEGQSVLQFRIRAKRFNGGQLSFSGVLLRSCTASIWQRFRNWKRDKFPKAAELPGRPADK
jgi:lipopolysaccharide biosynthesis glycosyltransferase